MTEQDIKSPKDAHRNDVLERFINAEVRVPEGEHLLFGKIVGLVYD